jgi:D-glycero-alpha-D-manno-heptose-7-phosphate kinase
MIISRSPLRLSLGGGGTDLPSYYREHEGFLIAASIDKYVYTTVMRPFSKGIYLKYSKIENCADINDVMHPIVREALKVMNFNSNQIEITSLADIPAGTGLGSSGSFTTALLKSLHAFKRQNIHQEELAELACEIEIDRLGEPIGKQDQYAAACGGITCYKFLKDDRVITSPLNISNSTLLDLEDNLLIFFTGFSRSASTILNDQNSKTLVNDREMLANLHYVKEIGNRSKDALEAGNTSLFGELMHEHWEHKKKRSGGMSNSQIDEWYNLGKQNGAYGGKLVGAGGGGFLMFMAEDRNKLRKTMSDRGLEEVRFKFDFEGTKIVMSS